MGLRIRNGEVAYWPNLGFARFGAMIRLRGLFSFEQYNTVEEKLHQPPVYTKSWFHTGAFLGRKKLSTLFAEAYWSDDANAWSLPDSVLPAGLSGTDAREAIRALAGKTLRTELYALDGTADEAKPYTVSEATFEVRQLQDRGINQYGVYLPLDRESLAYHYERVALLVGEELIEDPRIAHSFVLEVDDYGTPLRNASVVYPRRGSPTYAE